MLTVVSQIKFSDIETLKKRFLGLNRERLRRAEEAMRDTQRDFLDFLPLLFHINHPQLPGYVSKTTPSGVCDYLPSNRALIAANKYATNFDYQKRAQLRYDIAAMYLMGSSGTVAYSRKSDFDIWLCYRSGLAPQQLAELQLKATAIEKWAEGQGLEVHFFLMDPQSFKEGKIVDLSSESSGTAQYYLLLEEFYRTSLLLAGRFPVWWLVPVEHEHQYDKYIASLYDRRLVSEAECVDFGGIPTVPAEEFFGAALWQLFKGIDSPYKSVLKLMLMEVYASEYPNIGLLCLRFKKAIYNGETDIDRLDPYVMLYRKLEEYLVRNEDEERLELVRRCFYMKVNQRLSSPEPKRFDWRREMMRSLTAPWGWSRDYMQVLDARSNWKIPQVIKERGALVKELTICYQFLSAFARDHAQLFAINQRDLNALGRKLYAAFERKTGKVEIINRGIAHNVLEPNLTLFQIQQKGNEGGWAALVGSAEADLSNLTNVKRAYNLIEVLAWCHFNGLMDISTVLRLVRYDSHVTTRELEEVVKACSKYLQRQKVLETNIEDLGRAVRLSRSVIFVNLGFDPVIVHKRDGKHLASNRTDAFSYGGMFENLVLSFDQIAITSWKEVLTSHHEGIESIFDCVSAYLKWMPPSKGVAPPLPQIICVSSAHVMTIQQRVERLFADIIACFYEREDGQSARYIFTVERTNYALYLDDDTLRYQRLASHQEMLRYLGKGRTSFSQVVMDPLVVGDSVLPLTYKFNKPGAVQLFYREDGRATDIYVLDENGSLFHKRTEFIDKERLVGQYYRFFQSVLNRRYYQLNVSDVDRDALRVEFYRLWRDRNGGQQITAVEIRNPPVGGYFNIQVLVQKDAEERPVFTIYLDDTEFTSIEYGTNLFQEVANRIMQRRRSGQKYPLFITDVDLPDNLFQEYVGGRIPTVDFLHYKKTIEARLNEALDSLGGDS